ncbi:MAG: tetratricopeptide repeat protein [Thiogranum sp.]
MNREALEQMLAQGKDNALLRYTLGTICLKEGSLDDAVRHLQKALRQDDKHTASWKSYAKALAELGQVDDARAAYEKGIAVAESNGDIQAAREMKVFLKRLAG